MNFNMGVAQIAVVHVVAAPVAAVLEYDLTFRALVRCLRLLGLQCVSLRGWSVPEWLWRGVGWKLHSVSFGEL